MHSSARIRVRRRAGDVAPVPVMLSTMSRRSNAEALHSDMQWQRIADGKAKDKTERFCR